MCVHVLTVSMAHRHRILVTHLFHLLLSSPREPMPHELVDDPVIQLGFNRGVVSNRVVLTRLDQFLIIGKLQTRV